MHPASLALCVLLAFAAASPAAAALYKCAKDQGVVYQDLPCPPGKQLRDLEADPPTLSVLPGIPMATAPPTAKSKGSTPRERTTSARATAHRAGNPADRRFIRAGMSEGEVILRIGRPDVRTKGGAKGGQRWSYLPVAGDADTMTTLILAGGKVVEVERRVSR
jgi:hypothetical protein